MNNLSSYCGLVAARIRASDKDLPVTEKRNHMDRCFNCNIGCGVSSSWKQNWVDFLNTTIGKVEKFGLSIEKFIVFKP